MLGSIKKPSTIKRAERYIGKVSGEKKGPTLVFFGGIHGNEPAGVLALEQFFKNLESGAFQIRGTVIGIRGNIPALLQGKRFLKHDLNRLWTHEKIAEIQTKSVSYHSPEEIQLLEIHELLTNLLEFGIAPFYFIDFHTTSSCTLPFITINDALINRKFSRLFPVPIILGIEEYLEGPLLSLMNQMGYVSLGFESGQHNEIQAVKNSIAFLWLAIVFAGLLDKKEVVDFEEHYEQLIKSAENDTKFYEVVHRQKLTPSDSFKMLSNFSSFQKVMKDTPLAVQNQKVIKAKKNTILFMPLYQEQGAEGFFLIKNTPKWALGLSVLLRKIRFDRVLTLMPGISWSDTKKQSLIVNLSFARFLTKAFFHLLGYRNRTIDKTHELMTNRERTARNALYRNEPWY
jgi:hypothetical protein